MLLSVFFGGRGFLGCFFFAIRVHGQCSKHPLVMCRLREEIQQLQSRWDSNLKEMSRDAVTRDVELQSAHEEINRLKSDLAQRKDDLDRYMFTPCLYISLSLTFCLSVCLCITISLLLSLHILPVSAC